MDTKPAQNGLQFPLDWPARIIARDRDGIEDDLSKTLRAFGCGPVSVTRGNRSLRGRFVTFKASIRIEDRATLERVSYALSRVDGVRTVL